MGYRNYLMSISKKEYVKIKDLSNKELIKKFADKGDDYFDFHSLKKVGLKEIYEFGKYCDFETKGMIKKFFTKKMSWESDCEFKIANDKFILSCIDNYRMKVSDFYKKEAEKPLELIKNYLNTKSKYWAGEWIPYNIDRTKEHLVESWEYEHVIFDLVRIYKSFDFDKNVLVYSGY